MSKGKIIKRVAVFAAPIVMKQAKKYWKKRKEKKKMTSSRR